MIATLKEKKDNGYEWIDITNPGKEELNEVAARYDLHKALVEDSLQPEHLPKFEMVADTQFIILRVYSNLVPPEADTVQEITDKIAIFFGHSFLITIHREGFPFLVEIKNRYVDKGKCPTPLQLLFRIIYAGLATYNKPIAALAQELDFYEPKVFLQEKANSLLKNLYYIKRKASVMDFVFDLSRSILENLKGKIASTHFNQLKDEILLLQSNTRHVVDNVANLLNVYISLSSQRTNEVVRVLTVFSVFFMPLTFIVGIYGMNFAFMPELRWPYGYFYAMGLMVLVTLVIYLWFKKKGWL
ncbi:MAG TPA: CorA family divalent cation transporter [Cyclobacteriaceae bacterium]|nr:CorA family divalent cation transporter [Cyclobacteriaceae bacterium]